LLFVCARRLVAANNSNVTRTVAQIFNLPYRGFAIRKGSKTLKPLEGADSQPNAIRRDSRVQLCATNATSEASSVFIIWLSVFLVAYSIRERLLQIRLGDINHFVVLARNRAVLVTGIVLEIKLDVDFEMRAAGINESNRRYAMQSAVHR